MFSCPYTIKMADTDAAGVVFFARYFEIMHGAYETFLDSHGLFLGELLKQGKFILPLAGCQSRFLRPLFLSQQLDIQIGCTSLLEDQFELRFVFKVQGKPAAQLASQHVCLDGETRKRMALPESFLTALGSIQVSPNP